jgi:hypothetical protein
MKSSNKKPHKFFEKYLNIDTDRLANYLLKQYDRIENQTLRGISDLNVKKDLWITSQSRSTIKWQDYNVFQFYNEDIYDLFINIRNTLKEACDYYDVDYYKEKFLIQGWFNVNYNKKGKLDWHDHGPSGAPFFHGYYCVKAEPSRTHYRINNADEVININKDNRLILSEMGHPHAMADWEWDGPRITIAYDIIPLRTLVNPNRGVVEQHWFPLI